MRRVTITFGLLLALGGCQTGEIGTPCSGGPVESGACVEGAICTPNRDTSELPPDPPNAVGSTCRKLCDTEADCTEPGFECRVVPGSMARACQPEDDPVEPQPDGGA